MIKFMGTIIVMILIFIVGIGIGSAMSARKQDVKSQLTKLKEVDDELLTRQNDAVFLAGVSYKRFAKGDFNEIDVIEAEALTINRDVEEIGKRRKAIINELGL